MALASELAPASVWEWVSVLEQVLARGWALASGLGLDQASASALELASVWESAQVSGLVQEPGLAWESAQVWVSGWGLVEESESVLV